MRINNKVKKMTPLPQKHFQKRIENYKEAAKEFQLEREMAQKCQARLETENMVLKAEIAELRREREFQKTEIGIMRALLHKLGVF